MADDVFVSAIFERHWLQLRPSYCPVLKGTAADLASCGAYQRQGQESCSQHHHHWADGRPNWTHFQGNLLVWHSIAFQYSA